jgi:hypothetical protein
MNSQLPFGKVKRKRRYRTASPTGGNRQLRLTLTRSSQPSNINTTNLTHRSKQAQSTVVVVRITLFNVFANRL